MMLFQSFFKLFRCYYLIFIDWLFRNLNFQSSFIFFHLQKYLLSLEFEIFFYFDIVWNKVLQEIFIVKTGFDYNFIVIQFKLFILLRTFIVIYSFINCTMFLNHILIIVSRDNWFPIWKWNYCKYILIKKIILRLWKILNFCPLCSRLVCWK